MTTATPRGRLFRKYVVVLLVLVGGVLIASSLVELYFSYRETQQAIVRVERAKAVAAATGLHVSRLDGSPLVYNQADPYLPDLLICRPERAGPVITTLRA